MNGLPRDVNGSDSKLYSVEIENEQAEVESLFRETNEEYITPSSGSSNGMMARNFNFRKRVTPGSPTDSERNGYLFPTVLGLVRSQIGNAAVMRALGLVLALVFLSVAAMQVWNQTLEDSLHAHSTEKTHHGPSFGGIQNPLHFDSHSAEGVYHDDFVHRFEDDDMAKAIFESGFDDDAYRDQILAKSNVGTRVESISSANRANLVGHYLHDPIRSPFASPLYMSTHNNKSISEEMQSRFDHNMKVVTDRYGRWETPSVDGVIMPHHEDTTMHSVPYRDWTTFPELSWQLEPEYLTEFLHQAKALVHRVKEGIYTEYGWGILTEKSVEERDTKVARREDEFRVITKNFLIGDSSVAFDPVSEKRINGIAFLNEPAWEALVRKLLHAMMTTGDFFVVSAGPATSYLGNNFAQSSVMQFNYIMEPVLDKLGVRLVSRNMGMDSSVLNSALGGADIYGEADIMMYQGQPEDVSIMDFFHRQAILSGERVPILLTPSVKLLREATEDSIWAGNLQPGASFCSSSRIESGKFIVPKVKSCKYVVCTDEAASRCDKQNSVCWVDRPDVSKEMAEQDESIGREHQGLPNFNTQKLEGRKLAMLVLHALDEAIDRWTQQTEQGNLPLPSEMWHVGETYDSVRESVRTSKSTECGRLLHRIDRNLCHIELHVSKTAWERFCVTADISIILSTGLYGMDSSCPSPRTTSQDHCSKPTYC